MPLGRKQGRAQGRKPDPSRSRKVASNPPQIKRYTHCVRGGVLFPPSKSHKYNTFND